jgi:hypothetical protein
MELTIRALLEHRRNELLSFLSWRFGTQYWTGPFCYSTGLPRWLAVKLKCRQIEFSGGARPKNVLTIRDILRAEDAALHLGFRATLPKTVDKRFLRPPPCNLPPHTDRSVRIRFREWQARNPRDRVRKSERKVRPKPVVTEQSEISATSEATPSNFGAESSSEQCLNTSNPVGIDDRNISDKSRPSLLRQCD